MDPVSYEEHLEYLLGWCYSKLYYFRVQESSMENALKMDEIKLIFEGAYDGKSFSINPYDF